MPFFRLLHQRLLEIARVRPDDDVLDLTGAPDRLLARDDQRYDAIICASPLFFLLDGAAALKKWRRVLKTGGRVALAGLGDHALDSLAVWMAEPLARSGLPAIGTTWPPTVDPERCRALLRAADFENIEVRGEQMGYAVGTQEDAWEIACHSGFMHALAHVSAEEQERVRTKYITSARAAAPPGHCRLDVSVVLAVGERTY